MAVKLYYFNSRGIAEPIRWILSYSGTEFEDIRFPYDKFPPTLPVEIKASAAEGKSLTQSSAVTRYFAKKAGLVPEDNYLAALCDEYVDALKDMSTAFYQAFMSAGTDEAVRKEKLLAVREANNTKYLKVFENIAAANGGKHLVGNSLTWADVSLAYVLDHFKLAQGGASLINEQEHPALTKLWKNVVETPKIKEWIAKRPDTKL